MADKIIHPHTASGETLYVVFLNDEAQYWNGSAFENYNGANWGDYVIALNEFGNTAIYRESIPSDFPAGNYVWVCKEQAGGSPAVSDPNVGYASIDWDGDDIATIQAVINRGNTAWMTKTDDAVAGAVLATPANKLATDGSGYVTPTTASVTAIAAAVWVVATRVLTAPTNITSGIAQAVWEYATRVLTAGTNLPTAASIAAAVWAAGARTLTAFGFTVTETNSAAIKAVTDKVNTALELDGSVYRLTANALEQAPDGGTPPTAAAIADAVWDELVEDHDDAGSFGAAGNPATVAEAVMDAIVDGSVDVRNALKQVRGMAVGRVVRTDTDPPTFAVYNAAGDTVIATLEFAADGSERDVA